MPESRIGADEWVEQYAARLKSPSGLRARFYAIGNRLPLWAHLGIVLGIGTLIPLLTGNPFHLRVASTIALMAILAMGLHVVVGYAGLLDLGFAAFYGVGGYAYAYLSSDFTGIHLPTLVSVPIIIALGATVGLLLGLPSLRLFGDYLAIVTLAFGQIFVQLMTGLTRVNLPGLAQPVNLTGGPNGIIQLDPIAVFGFSANTLAANYYIRLIVLVLVLLFVQHLNRSRLGRAWRAMREDELAAQTMGMPTQRLKVLAFVIGAAIAALAGALFAAGQRSVFPANFDITLLITLYAILVLGGLGSLPGVLVGSVVMVAFPEILRDVGLATTLFYAGLVIVLLGLVKPRWQVPILLVAVMLSGFLLKLLINAIWPDSLTIAPTSSVFLVDAIRSWLIMPGNDVLLIGNLATGLLILLILGVWRMRRQLWRFVAFVPTLYVLIFVWETRLSQEASVTRLIFVGSLLVALMIYRPQGLLGQKRVEIV